MQFGRKKNCVWIDRIKWLEILMSEFKNFMSEFKWCVWIQDAYVFEFENAYVWIQEASSIDVDDQEA